MGAGAATAVQTILHCSRAAHRRPPLLRCSRAARRRPLHCPACAALFTAAAWWPARNCRPAGHGLKDVELMGANDPYVVLELHGQRVQTDVDRSGGENPASGGVPGLPTGCCTGQHVHTGCGCTPA